MGWRAAVAAAVAVVVLALAAAPLYASSSADAAVARQLDGVCPSAIGTQLTAGPDLTSSMQGAVLDLQREAATVPHSLPPVITRQTNPLPYARVGDPNPLGRLAVLLSRPGDLAQLAPGHAPLTGDQVLVPSYLAKALGLHVGDRLVYGPDALPKPVPPPGVPQPPPPPRPPVPVVVSITVAGTYTNVRTDPVPDFWCGQVNLWRPNQFGDLPPAVFIAAPAPFAQLNSQFRSNAETVITSGLVHDTWEIRVDTRGLRRDEAVATEAALEKLAADYNEALGFQPSMPRGPVVRAPELGPAAARAGGVAGIVARNDSPACAAAAAAGLAVLVAAGILAARRRERELTLLVRRGAGPLALTARNLPSMAVPVAAGAFGGWTLARVGVADFGPSALVEPSAGHRAVTLSIAGAVVALLIATATVVFASLAKVDARVRRRRIPVPWEVAVVGVLALSWSQLDRAGGVQLLGATPSGGDGLAQAFPVILLACVLVVLVRPIAAIARRARFAGAALPVGPRLGFRRVVGEPRASLVMLVAGGLAIGTWCSSVLLTDAVSASLHRKSDVYLGTHLVVTTTLTKPVPRAIAAESTTVRRGGGHSGEQPLDILGVDPATFARGAAWHGSTARLQHLLALLKPHAGSAALPAIVVGGPLPERTVRTFTQLPIELDPVATEATFPGLHAGGTMVVVDSAALKAAGVDGNIELWFLHPAADTANRVTAAGLPVLDTVDESGVFDTTSFLTVAWSYAGLRAVGVLVGMLALLAQLLVLAARRHERQLALVMTRPMGVRARSHVAAAVTELAVPVVAAAVAGAGLAVFSCAVGVPRLDGLRHLEPVAGLVVQSGAFVPAFVAAAAALVVLSSVAVAVLMRANTAEVLRTD